jgi:hypothetical protein
MKISARAVGAAASTVLGLGLAAGLAGCGGDSSTAAQDPAASVSPSATSSASKHAAPDGPACTTVWHAGATLPHTYKGCTADAAWVRPDVYRCEDGHRLVTYAHTYYAQPGKSVTKVSTTLGHDPQFQAELSHCGA